MSDTNTSGSAPVKKNITRRDVLAMAGCGVAGLVVGGALASWGVTQESIASGRIELRTTPTKMIVTDRARCSGCQRCEMMCTLKNDGRVCQHIARVRVWDNYYWGKSADTGDGSFGDGKGACEFTVEHCKQCADAQCVKYCPVHAIYADEKTGARIIAKALTEPMKQIAANAGIDGSVVLEKVKTAGKAGYGFDAYKEEYCDMIASGIVDPTKVTRSALENAASVSAMVLTTESLVADKPEPPAAPAAPGMGDMGGMY